MRFHFPPLSDDPKRPWGPWVDLDPDNISLSGMVADSIDAVRDRLLFVPTVQLKWAYCDPDTNLWSQSPDPGACVRAVYRHLWHRTPEIEDARLALQAQIDRIGAIKDNLAGFGYSQADLLYLNADQSFLTEHLKSIKDALKHVRGHSQGKRVLRTVISEALTETVIAPPNFNFRTQPIHGLPFLNGRLITGAVTQQDEDGTRQTRPSVRLVPYAPTDLVEQTRPIQRTFDMTGATRRADVRYLLDTGAEHAPDAPPARPYGWEWMLRGFLGLPRPSSPPRTARPSTQRTGPTSWTGASGRRGGTAARTPTCTGARSSRASRLTGPTCSTGSTASSRPRSSPTARRRSSGSRSCSARPTPASRPSST